MSSTPIVSTSRRTDITPEQARNARARAWVFIFDTYRQKTARQDNAKTKEKRLNAKEGGSHDLIRSSNTTPAKQSRQEQNGEINADIHPDRLRAGATRPLHRQTGEDRGGN